MRIPPSRVQAPTAQLRQEGPAPAGNEAKPQVAELDSSFEVAQSGSASPANRAEATKETAKQAVKKAKKGKPPKAKDPVLEPARREELKQALASVGVPDKFLAKAKDKTLVKNFEKVKAGLEAGSPKIKTKFGKYTVTSKFNPAGELVDVKVKKKTSGLKKALGVVLQVASFIPGPIGIVARVVSAVKGGVAAIKGGNLLGGIAGVLGGVSGLGGLGGAAGRAFSGISNTVGRVANVVGRIDTAVTAIRNRDIGGLLGSIAGNNPGLNRLASVANGIQAARAGDLGGVLGAAAGVTNNEGLGRLAGFVSTAQNVRNAVRGGDLLGAAGALTGFVGSQSTNPQTQQRLEMFSSALQAAAELRAANQAQTYSVAVPGGTQLGQTLEDVGLTEQGQALSDASAQLMEAEASNDDAALAEAGARFDEAVQNGAEALSEQLQPTG